jgi:hypothetical protein
MFDVDRCYRNSFISLYAMVSTSITHICIIAHRMLSRIRQSGTASYLGSWIFVLLSFPGSHLDDGGDVFNITYPESGAPHKRHTNFFYIFRTPVLYFIHVWIKFSTSDLTWSSWPGDDVYGSALNMILLLRVDVVCSSISTSPDVVQQFPIRLHLPITKPFVSFSTVVIPPPSIIEIGLSILVVKQWKRNYHKKVVKILNCY